ncbi:MAG: urea ABC transporter ATP-binding subunit UrtE [Gammaproteobacteria bacterium]|jgi:urea transport system ATP-binding protein|nr:urea ABC transporter ATP-binding subunit UrtE [Gammaproteobacteria bacterium]MCP4880965.1 urea ABC transporter ATP-binding subunit UrtE [Gammaproteobacteria bacterium]MDP6164579.1 urea ABC transporter ATP-binding subunit UrtE [Gammaproteobacteria bacterium]
MLKVEGINQFYGQSHILWDLDMHVEEGKCTVLMGRNGVGKTTLLNSIMGQLKTTTGAMLFEGQDLTKLSVEQRPGIGIGYVPQGRQIFPLMTVEENLQIGLPVLPRGQRFIAPYIFDLFPVLKDMLSRRGGDLSGGQQQQLAIARALVVNPKLLILDEPTEGIQPNIVREIGDIIGKLNDQLNLTVLLVEQKLPFARRVGDNFCILDRGRRVAQGAMADLDDKLVRQYLTV